MFVTSQVEGTDGQRKQHIAGVGRFGEQVVRSAPADRLCDLLFVLLCRASCVDTHVESWCDGVNK
jgi:hypothetical protein